MKFVIPTDGFSRSGGICGSSHSGMIFPSGPNTDSSTPAGNVAHLRSQ